VTIKDLIVLWCKGIAFSFHCVKGHADRIDRPLTRDERLNIEADIHADAIRAQACGSIAAHPDCPHWDIKEASFLIRGSKVTSDMKNQLTPHMHDGNLCYFLMQKSPGPLKYLTLSTGMLVSGPLDGFRRITK
jgi:hypothetical protein